MIASMALDVDDDRKARNQQVEADLVRVAAMLLLVPAVVLGAVAALVVNVVVGLGVLLVVGGALAAWMFVSLPGFGARLVAGSAGVALTEDAAPRLHNLVDGLCVAHGVTRPELVGVSGPGANIASITTGRGSSASTALVVSQPLLDSLSRIELEGVVAQQLSQFLDGSSSLATLVAALRSTPVLGAVLGSRLDRATDPERQAWADVAGVRMTRYPPGLASALETLASGSTEIATADAASAPLWLAPPIAGAAAHEDEPTLAVRAAMLRER